MGGTMGTADTVSGLQAAKDSMNYQKIVLAVGVALMLIKFFAFLITDSVSILTDAMESIVNVVAAAIGLYALYLSSIPRDANHPFGHGKVENISSSIEGAMICFAGLMIIFQAAERILNPQEITSLDVGVLLIAATAVVNYLTGYYAVRKGRRNRSMALVASGKHLCSDTYSSIGIIAGLLTMMALKAMGIDAMWLDGAIAALFGAIILRTGVKVVKDAFDSTMDKADMDTVDAILQTIRERRHTDWIDVHNIRVIKYGSVLHVQMHLVLPRYMDMVQQDREINEIRESIRAGFGDSVDLILMGEPCSDAFCEHCARECPCRTSEFCSFREWTAEKASMESPRL